MRIGARQIGPGREPFVIAELGVNHDGSVERALALTEAASAAGADAVKLQFFRADLLLSKASRLAVYQTNAGEADPAAMLRRLELSIDQMAAVVARAHERGVAVIVTVFSVPLVREAAALPWDAYKVASPDLVNKPLLDALAGTRLPIIVSTGAATIEEVKRAATWLEGCDTAFLQCVSAYPTPDDAAEVAAIGEIARATGRPVGYSDHTSRVETAAVAVGAGAGILEKHLTLDRRAQGPDHAASLEPEQFAQYVRLARLAWRLRGDGGKRLLDVERDVRELSRQSVVSARPIPSGRTITADDLTIKRPGTGLPPFMLGEVRGRAAARDIDADTPIREEDLA